MTSPDAGHLLRRYMAARQQLTDLDAQRDYLASLSRRALARFDQASDTDRRQAGLEHDALHRATTLFEDKHDQLTRSRLHATMQTTSAELKASGTDPEEEVRRLDGLRASWTAPRSFAEIRTRLREALGRAKAGEEAAWRVLAQTYDELEATPDEQSPPACLVDAQDLVASPVALTVPGAPSQPADTNSQPKLPTHACREYRA